MLCVSCVCACFIMHAGRHSVHRLPYPYPVVLFPLPDGEDTTGTPLQLLRAMRHVVLSVLVRHTHTQTHIYVHIHCLCLRLPKDVYSTGIVRYKVFFLMQVFATVLVFFVAAPTATHRLPAPTHTPSRPHKHHHSRCPARK